MIERSGINREDGWTALDIGGAFWNGSARPELPNADWTVLDLEQPQFDLKEQHAWDKYVVGDATTWRPEDGSKFHVILCTEVFEHTKDWPLIIETAREVLHLDGIFIVTCASEHRPAHGATGASSPLDGEWYENVSASALNFQLEQRFEDVHVEYAYPPGDAYALARKPR
jgi:2-polyprenyl-3-methyl-5-hydroxy-6-metoxy-1,4-benzoquinol methylase